jgi:hypothetical protein
MKRFIYFERLDLYIKCFFYETNERLKMSEMHTGISEKFEIFGGLKYRKRHTVRSLKSARAWQKKYESEGYNTRIEKERVGFYNVYVRRK